MKKNLVLTILGPMLLALAASGCATGGSEVKKQGYARLAVERTYEFELPTVWRGIETVVRDYTITSRDPDDLDAQEAKKVARRKLETEWVYTQSRDKYQEYSVNGTPRRKPLQSRLKYQIQAERILAGTQVKIQLEEEVESLHNDGSSAGYRRVADIDTSRTHELLEKIQAAILAAPPGT